MKKSFPIISAIIIGICLAKFMFNQYTYEAKIGTVFKNGEKLSFITYGIYSSKDSMEKECSNLKSYIYSIENDKYYVYLAITKNELNLEKLKGYFNSIGYDVSVRELNVTNESYLELLEQYDILLSKTDDINVIEAISSQSITKYKECDNN